MTPAHPADPLLDPVFLGQLLCTRLCHDMSGPVGALANGAELIGDDPEMVDAESLGLLTDSAAGAALKLRTLRAAFGRPGGLEAGEMDRLLRGWAGPRTAVILPPPDVMGALDGEGLQLLLNMALTVLDGTLAPARLVLETAGPARLSATGAGRGPRDAQAIVDALAGTAGADLGPRTVQAWFTGALARRAGSTPVVTPATDGMVLAVGFPS